MKRFLTGMVAVVWAVVTVALAVVGLVRLDAVGGRIEHVEGRVQTIRHEIVTLPCAHGDDVTCRRFLAILLSKATATQLEQLLRAKRIKLTSAKVRALERLLAHRGRRGRPVRRRRGVMPGKEPPTKGRRRRSRHRPGATVGARHGPQR